MPARPATIALLAVLAACGFAVAPAAAAAAARTCGTARLVQGGGVVRVAIARGSLPCSQARGIARLFGSSRGTAHGLGGPHNLFYATYPRGWTCGPLEHGNSTCWRGGGSIRDISKARDVVGLMLVAG